MNSSNPHLSLRELQVMRLAAEGQTAKAIALALHISASAVSMYMMHARLKLGVKTKSEAIAMLVDTGAVLIESIERTKSAMRDESNMKNDQLRQMQLISNQLRHLVEGMLLADTTDKVQHADTTVWREMAERLLRTAANTIGYEIVKVRVAEAADNTANPNHSGAVGHSSKNQV
jgi:DNA-binding CsgD family transcriptional regulator